MKDSYFFSTKKIVNLDESTIGYSGGKIVVKNKYSGETEFEHDLAASPLGIRGENILVELGNLTFEGTGIAIRIPVQHLHSLNIVLMKSGEPLLLIKTQAYQTTELPVATPVEIGIQSVNLTVQLYAVSPPIT